MTKYRRYKSDSEYAGKSPFYHSMFVCIPMKEIRIALSQMRCVAGDVEGNMSRIMESVDDAGTEKANLLLLPEMCITGYATDGDIPELPQAGAEIRDIALHALKREMAVCIGLCEGADGMPFNTEVLVEDGVMKGYYRKTHLGELEKTVFAPGDHIHCIHTSLGIFGVPVCWECRFPEISTTLALQGADVLLVPTASGMMAERRREVWDRILPARAADNTCFVAAVNARGDNGRGVTFGGGASIRGPHGELLGEDYEGNMLVADLDPAELGMRKMDYVSMRDVYYLPRRKPQLYGEVTKGRWRTILEDGRPYTQRLQRFYSGACVR